MLCINRVKLYPLHVDHCTRNEDVEREEQVEVNTWHLLSGIFRCGTFLSARDQEKLSTSTILYPYTYPEDTYIMASTSALSNSKVSELQQSGDFSIKSESVTPKLGTFGR
jgi:hypothetical protein